MNPTKAALLMLLIPFAGAVLVPLLALIWRRAVPAFSVLTGLMAALAAFFLPGALPQNANMSFEWLPGFITTGFLFDTLSVVPALIATWIGFLVLVYSLGYMKDEENLPRYYSLTLLFIGAMTGMSLADNFLTLFFFWEVMGVCSYLLIGFFYKDPKAAAAGVKAFIVTRIGDIGLLAAILILYRSSGSFSIAHNIAFAAQVSLPLLAVVSFGFIIGAVGKSAQVPLHVWLPDAMEAPTTISALIHAATMVNAGVYLLARVHPILVHVPSAIATVQWIGAVTAFLAAFLATFNFDLKRILAYSTVSQLGYMVFAIGAGGVFASQFHLFSHAIFKALLFLCAGSVIHSVGSRDIRDMGGLRKLMPITAFTFFIGALALMGMPILNGFFSKDLILEAAVKSNAYMPLTLAALAAVLTAFYSLSTTAKVFWGNRESHIHVHEAPISMTLPLMLLAAGSVISWVMIGPITSSWAATGLETELINWKELMAHTFTSAAFMLTAAAIIIGYILFYFRETWKEYLNINFPALIRAIGTGLGFDAFYNGFVAFVRGTGIFVRCLWDEIVMEGINRATGAVSVAASDTSRKMQTGDIHWNLVYIVVTLIIVASLIF